jgi:arylsulfatase A-like enzyme
MTDQQHFRMLGCHGVPEARTPNLDRLARTLQLN